MISLSLTVGDLNTSKQYGTCMTSERKLKKKALLQKDDFTSSQSSIRLQDSIRKFGKKKNTAPGLKAAKICRYESQRISPDRPFSKGKSLNLTSLEKFLSPAKVAFGGKSIKYLKSSRIKTRRRTNPEIEINTKLSLN